MKTRPSVIGGLTALGVVALAMPALAAWTLPAGTGTSAGTAASLNAPTGVSAAAVAPTSSSIDISYTAPSNPTGTTYTVTRSTSKSGAAGSQTVCSGAAASPCHDTGLTAGLTFTYTVSAVLQGWAKAAADVTASTQAASATKFAISAPTTFVAGTSSLVTVTAQRADNSTDTNYNGTLVWSGSAYQSSPSPSNTVPTAVQATAFANGVATYNVTLTRAANNVVLTATQGSLTGSATVSVTRANVQLTLSCPSSASKGSTITATLGRPATDAFSNAVTGAAVTASVSYTNASTTGQSVTIASANTSMNFSVVLSNANNTTTVISTDAPTGYTAANTCSTTHTN